MAPTVRPSVIEPISLRALCVLETTAVSPTVRRVVLGGAELAGATRDGHRLAPMVSAGPDDEVKLFFPDPVTGVLSLPVQRAGVIEWPREPRATSRTYTVRALDPASGRLSIDLVLHGRGVASDWARRCVPGDVVHVAGPKMSLLHPADTDWVLLAGDETALPSVARWLEELPSGTRAEVYLEVAGPAEEVELAGRDDVRVTWVHRGSGGTGALAAAVQAGPWHDGAVFAWVAGEATAIRPLRRWLREERDVPPERVEVTGYWRATASPAEEDGDDGPDDGDRLHELADTLPSRAVRVLATLDLVPLLRGGPRSTAELAAATATDPAALGRFLRYCATIDLLEPGAEGWTATSLGAELDDEETTDQLRLDRLPGRLDLVLDHLLTAVRTGGPVVAAALGGDLDTLADGDHRVAADLEALAAEESAWLRPAFAAAYRFTAGEPVTVGGPGGAVLLADALTGPAAPAVTLISRPSRTAAALAQLPSAARDRVAVHPGTTLDTWPTAHTVLVAGALAELPDDDAVLVLQRARAAVVPGGRLLVVEHLLVEAEVDDHDAADDLRLLCLHGSGFRTRNEVLALLARAGLAPDRETLVGWGEPVFEVDAR